MPECKLPSRRKLIMKFQTRENLISRKNLFEITISTNPFITIFPAFAWSHLNARCDANALIDFYATRTPLAEGLKIISHYFSFSGCAPSPCMQNIYTEGRALMNRRKFNGRQECWSEKRGKNFSSAEMVGSSLKGKGEGDEEKEGAAEGADEKEEKWKLSCGIPCRVITVELTSVSEIYLAIWIE